MGKEEKKHLIVLSIRVIVSLTLALLGVFLFNEENYPFYVNLIVMLLSYLIISYDVIIEGIEKIIKDHDFFNENSLMIIASIGAFCLRFFGKDHNEFLEGVLVILLYQVGEFFEDLSEGQSKRSITKTLDLRKENASVITADGSLVLKNAEELLVGDVCLLKVGEKALCDAVVEAGKGSFDESSLSGESLPVDKKEGDVIYGGSVLVSGSLKIKITKDYHDSFSEKLLNLLLTSGEQKSKATRFIDAFSKVYTPIVIALAVLIAIIPPLFMGIGDTQVWARWLYTALCFLVIGCPCAIVISVPLAYFSGLGLASRHGLIIKGASYIDKLNNVKYIGFDKTGTLTTGKLNVNLIHPVGLEKDEFMDYMIAAESCSDHPLAKAIYGSKDLSQYVKEVSSYEEIAGFGVRCVYKGHKLLAGKADILNSSILDFDPSTVDGTLVFLVVDNQYSGYLSLSDEIRPEAQESIEQIKQLGLTPIIISGDRERNVEALAKTLGISEYHAGLSPEEKQTVIRETIAKNQGYLAYVGDGINDAPSLRLSDVGIAMGGLGSQQAIESADVVLMNDSLKELPGLFRIAKKTKIRSIVNISVALAIKVAVMVVSMCWSQFPLYAAVLADTGLTLVLVLNSLLLSFSKVSQKKN